MGRLLFRTVRRCKGPADNIHGDPPQVWQAFLSRHNYQRIWENTYNGRKAFTVSTDQVAGCRNLTFDQTLPKLHLYEYCLSCRCKRGAKAPATRM